MPSFPAPPRCGRHFSTSAAVPALDSRGHQPGVELARTATLRWLVVASVAALGVFAPGAFAASWVVQNAAVPPAPNGELGAVSCPTNRWCTAVGSYTDRSYRVRPLFEIFDGHRWHRAPSTDLPDLTAPADAASGSFRAVSCTSPVACVAVGTTGYNSGTSSFSSLAADGTVACGQRCPHRRSMSTTLCRACPRACASPSGREQRIGTGYGGPRTGCRIPVG